MRSRLPPWWGLTKGEKTMNYKEEQQDALSEDNMAGYINAKAGELIDLMERKHDQYAASNDDLANFRAGALLHSGSSDYYEMYEESKAYCRKHIAHVYGKGQDINTDKLMESLGDIVVYSLIQMYMVEKHYMECREMLEE